MARETITGITHGPKGYDKGCGCPVCTAANTSRAARRRERRKAECEGEPITRRIGSTSVASLVAASSTFDAVTAQGLARQDMTDILSSLAADSVWRGFVEEGIPGELATLQNLIDRHNRSGSFPPIQYGFHEGNFWVGVPDKTTDETASYHTVTGQAATGHSEPTQTVQLPKSAAMSMPRNVRTGRAPTVPTGLVSEDATGDVNPDSQTWG